MPSRLLCPKRYHKHRLFDFYNIRQNEDRNNYRSSFLRWGYNLYNNLSNISFHNKTDLFRILAAPNNHKYRNSN